jgi:hypothetical protein
MNRTVLAGIGAAAAVLAAAPTANAATYTAGLTGTVTMTVDTRNQDNLRSSTCTGDEVRTNAHKITVDLKKASGKAFTSELRGNRHDMRVRLVGREATFSTTTAFNYAPISPSNAADCPTSPPVTDSGSCVYLFGNQGIDFALRAVSGKLAFENGMFPGELFGATGESEPGSCRAESDSGAGILQRTPIRTKLTVKKVKALKKGKSVSASGAIAETVTDDNFGGGGTRVLTFTGKYKLTFKRVK